MSNAIRSKEFLMLANDSKDVHGKEFLAMVAQSKLGICMQALSGHAKLLSGKHALLAKIQDSLPYLQDYFAYGLTVDAASGKVPARLMRFKFCPILVKKLKAGDFEGADFINGPGGCLAIMDLETALLRCLCL